MTPRRSGANPDAIVIGAGIIGLMTARALHARGVDVLVIDRDSPGRRATWAAGGMLSPLIESDHDDPFFRLADRSFDLYPPMLDELHAVTGLHVDYRTTGKLQCALDAAGASALARLAASPRAERYGLRHYTGSDARALEPSLSERVVSALFVERDHCVDNRLLVQALVAAVEADGIAVRIGTPVDGVIVDRDVVKGVRLTSGERIDAPHVVIAAGAWSAQLDGLPAPLPVHPLRGQMLAVDMRVADGASAVAFERVVGTAECYMIPRSDGRLLIGATVEDVGFQMGPTPGGLAWLIDAATAVVPGVADLPILETWAGYRPGTPDDWPIIGEDPHVRGLVYATGHYRNGILLGPVTALAVAELVVGRAPEWVEPFAVSRFGPPFGLSD